MTIPGEPMLSSRFVRIALRRKSQVGGDIGEEIHTVDQSLTFLSGTARAEVNGMLSYALRAVCYSELFPVGEKAEVTTGDLVIVPAGKFLLAEEV